MIYVTGMALYLQQRLSFPEEQEQESERRNGPFLEEEKQDTRRNGGRDPRESHDAGTPAEIFPALFGWEVIAHQTAPDRSDQIGKDPEDRDHEDQNEHSCLEGQNGKERDRQQENGLEERGPHEEKQAASEAVHDLHGEELGKGPQEMGHRDEKTDVQRCGAQK